jgi:type IV pilus assembly protein PilM
VVKGSSLFSINTHLRPAAACEILPDGIAAARRTAPDALSLGYVSLPAGAVTPGLKTPNLVDAQAVSQAARRALEQVGARDKNVTVIVPDAAARVLILDFDSLPGRQRDALPIIRFRLRKLLPFEVDEAAVSYQVMANLSGQMSVLVVAIPQPVLAEYEAVIRAAGFEPGVVLTSTIASLAALTVSDAALIVNRNGASVTTAITRNDELLLHRTLDLPPQLEFHHEELAQAVTVAVAYFEDTLKTLPASIYYAGPGGAEEFASVVDHNDPLAPRVRDLVSPVNAGLTSSLPKGVTAGVTGALAS